MHMGIGISDRQLFRSGIETKDMSLWSIHEFRTAVVRRSIRVRAFAKSAQN